MPGVIPTTRLGETFTDEQVRVVFDGTAGANATRTSTENRIVLPFGAESGRRIIADGEAGFIAFYDENDDLVGLLDTDRWVIGDVENSGARVQLDPIGGLTIRSDGDELVSILDQNGYTLRDPTTGLVTAEIHPGSFRLIDPNGVDDIEMVTESTGTLPNPVYRSAVEVNPGASLVAPAAPNFTATPADDIGIDHVAAWIRATNQAATMTPPAGYTERADEAFSLAQGTLQTSVATKHPADTTAHTFTSSQTNWQHAVGTRVVIKGSGASSPSFRSISYAESVATGSTHVATIAKPAGTVANDALVVFVSLGVNGGSVPTGWVTPPGFVFLGANFSTSGSGATQTTVATGAWAKLAGASEPADYSTTINLPTGTKLIAASMVAIQNAFLVPGGVQIRMAGHPTRRLLAFNELQAASATLCDFQNIPQGYDNLELVYDTTSTGGGATLRAFLRFNADAGNNYFYRISQEAGVTATGFGVPTLAIGGLANTAGARAAGSCNIYGYASTPNPVMLGHSYHGVALAVHDESMSGQWNSAAAINRILLQTTGAPANPQFAIGSRAYLYGY